MKLLTKNSLKFFLTALFFSLFFMGFSQSLSEAAEYYNSGNDQFSAKDYATSIDSYNNCIDACLMLGAQGNDLRAKAEKQLANAYYKHAINLYKGKKFDQAINTFKKAGEQAKTLGDTKLQKKALAYVPKVYTSVGLGLIKKKDYPNAMEKFNKALLLNPKYNKAYYGQGLVYKEKGETENFKKAFDKVIEIGPEEDKTVINSKEIAQNYFISEGGMAVQKEHYDKAIDLLNSSFSYGDKDANAYYFIALAYNGKKQWAKAVEAGNKALEFEKNNKTNIYFVLGNAYQGTGDKLAACNAYKNVTSGPNVDAAKHQMKEVLKCN
ncbi:MAG: tetratricopeptide repeat protein [Bacteroidales bacterium]|nr:tetratricopeptide repeat protein [Bacteroidales bacterium]